jgi:PKHD-type hydroxylase
VVLIQIPEVLSAEQVRQCLYLVAQADWADGRITAGTQSAAVKNNLQLPESSEAARAARAIVQAGLERSALFFTAALPRQIYPPLFNRYSGTTNVFGNHVDNAIRTHPPTGLRVRTDLSATLFLSAPEDYDGGELVIEDTFGPRSVKLPAGDMVLYPASSVHRVEPVTRGARIASFFWMESMVRDDAQRRMLFELDMAILELRGTQGESAPVIQLTNCYHNLLRMWAQA